MPAGVQALPAGSSKLAFVNFGERIYLDEMQEEPGRYTVSGSTLKVKIADRLIVKTEASLQGEDLYRIDKRIGKVLSLYTSEGFNYYSVNYSYDANTLAQTAVDLIDKLNGSQGVLLVQPDILQLDAKVKQTNSTTGTDGKESTYTYPNQLRLTRLWQNTLGKGVTVAIIDNGIALEHNEFSDVNTLLEYDVLTQQLNAMPKQQSEKHGTLVAGIIFARHDNKGVEGIAPEANLVAIRQPDSWTSNTLLSFQVARLADSDIINCSWSTPILMQPISDVVTDLAHTGREGRGTVIVFAAGNSGSKVISNQTEASIEAAVVVAASNSEGQRLAFSNYGQTIDLLAYGLPLQSVYFKGGYAPFSGTSLSSALVTGHIALLMSISPELTHEQLIFQVKNELGFGDQVVH